MRNVMEELRKEVQSNEDYDKALTKEVYAEAKRISGQPILNNSLPNWKVVCKAYDVVIEREIGRDWRKNLSKNLIGMILKVNGRLAEWLLHTPGKRESFERGSVSSNLTSSAIFDSLARLVAILRIEEVYVFGWVKNSSRF